MGIKPLFRAVATVTGGRNGHTAAEDGSISVSIGPRDAGGFGLA